MANVKAILDDIRGHGNDQVMLPGQLDANAAARTAQHGGLLFTTAEIEAFNEIARECGAELWNPAALKTVTL